MKRDFTEHFLYSIAKAPERMQKAFDKQSRLLLENIRHPSLRAKKYDEVNGLWQARLTKGWRFHFLIQGDTYIFTHIGPHPK